jgi:hypothetical protein
MGKKATLLSLRYHDLRSVSLRHIWYATVLKTARNTTKITTIMTILLTRACIDGALVLGFLFALVTTSAFSVQWWKRRVLYFMRILLSSPEKITMPNIEGVLRNTLPLYIT